MSRLCRLESNVVGEPEVESKATLQTVVHQQSVQLMEVASAVEKLTEAISWQNQEIISVRKEIRAFHGSKLEMLSDEMSKQIKSLEKRFYQIEKSHEARLTPVPSMSIEIQQLHASFEDLRKRTDQKLASIRELDNIALSRKANWDDVHTLMADKADKTALINGLLGKADIDEVRQLVANAQAREESTIDHKRYLEQMNEKLASQESSVKKLRKDLDSIISENLTSLKVEENMSKNVDDVASIQAICEEYIMSSPTIERHVLQIIEPRLEGSIFQVIEQWGTDPDGNFLLSLDDLR